MDTSLQEPCGSRQIQALDPSGSNEELQSHASTEPILYEGEEANGFDMGTGGSWMYPTNFPIRDYQYNIVQKALFSNTLVCLPTGLGKTFIAAVVMYNMYRWYPLGKIIFMAPTKPLVAQQVESCYRVMGIPAHDTVEMTGAMVPTKRREEWQQRRVFFLTPHVLVNDLASNSCPAHLIRCVVVDEAHKATGNHSYCQVIRALNNRTPCFRILALSATPGYDMIGVKQVIENLHIAHIEYRTESSVDVAPYTHERDIKTIVVPLGAQLTSVRAQFVNLLTFYAEILKRHNLIYGSPFNLTKYQLIQVRSKMQFNPPAGLSRSELSSLESTIVVCMSLCHASELLVSHGLRAFYNYLKGSLEQDRSPLAALRHSGQLNKILEDVSQQLGDVRIVEQNPDLSIITELSDTPYVMTHPKQLHVKAIILDHFSRFKEQCTRAMIFCQYRDAVIELSHLLQLFRPLVKPMSFVGQSSVNKHSKGLTQKQQIEVVARFRAGGYNVLVSTCVGEEGLDIGEVDLIICYDAQRSPTRMVQRMGRTGRQRQGQVVVLATEGKEHNKLRQSVVLKKSLFHHLANLTPLRPFFYKNDPSMLPPGVAPTCHKMRMTIDAVPGKDSPKKRRGCKSGNLREMILKKAQEVANSKLAAYASVEELSTMSLPTRFLLASEFLLLNSRGKLRNRETHLQEDDTEKLRLSEYLDWQRDLQTTAKVGHSHHTELLVELLESVGDPSTMPGVVSQDGTDAVLHQVKRMKLSKEENEEVHVENATSPLDPTILRPECSLGQVLLESCRHGHDIRIPDKAVNDQEVLQTLYPEEYQNDASNEGALVICSKLNNIQKLLCSVGRSEQCCKSEIREPHVGHRLIGLQEYFEPVSFTKKNNVSVPYVPNLQHLKAMLGECELESAQRTSEPKDADMMSPASDKDVFLDETKCQNISGLVLNFDLGNSLLEFDSHEDDKPESSKKETEWEVSSSIVNKHTNLKIPPSNSQMTEAGCSKVLNTPHFTPSFKLFHDNDIMSIFSDYEHPHSPDHIVSQKHCNKQDVPNCSDVCLHENEVTDVSVDNCGQHTAMSDESRITASSVTKMIHYSRMTTNLLNKRFIEDDSTFSDFEEPKSSRHTTNKHPKLTHTFDFNDGCSIRKSAAQITCSDELTKYEVNCGNALERATRYVSEQVPSEDGDQVVSVKSRRERSMSPSLISSGRQGSSNSFHVSECFSKESQLAEMEESLIRPVKIGKARVLDISHTQMTAGRAVPYKPAPHLVKAFLDTEAALDSEDDVSADEEDDNPNAYVDDSFIDNDSIVETSVHYRMNFSRPSTSTGLRQKDSSDILDGSESFDSVQLNDEYDSEDSFVHNGSTVSVESELSELEVMEKELEDRKRNKK